MARRARPGGRGVDRRRRRSPHASGTSRRPGARLAPVAKLRSVANASLRKVILAAADSNRVQRIVRRYGMSLGARRFVPGETLDECVAALRTLNDKGLDANTTLLGEGVIEPAQSAAVVEAYREIIARIAAER